MAAVTIHGSNFAGTPQVFLGSSTAMAEVSLVNSSELLAQVPAGVPAGVYPVRVCNPDGQCGSLPDGFTVMGSGPLLRAVAPRQSYNDTPSDLVLYGFNFQSGGSVTVGSQALANVVWINATQARGVLPAGMAPGVYTVTMRNPGATAPSVLENAYTVLDVTSDDFFANDEDLWSDPLTIREGATVWLGLNVHRQGGKTAQQVTVAFSRLLADGTRREIGRVLSAPINPGRESIEALMLEWNTSGLSGAIAIVADIDPDNSVSEATKNNNRASRTITLLATASDSTAPSVDRLLVNNGAVETTNPAVSVVIEASDTGGSGLTSLYLVEREFNSAARQWVAVQSVGWIPFQSPTPLTLTNRGGARYIQAWVSDGAGNISRVIARTHIDYVPATDSLLQGQVRLYRRTLGVGQAINVTLRTISGDADLYVWGPNGTRSGISNLPDTATDQVRFTAPASGDYQIEVAGYVDSVYGLAVDTNANAAEAALTPSEFYAPNKVERSQPIVAPANVPAESMSVPAAPMGGTPPATGIRLYLPAVKR